MKSIKPGRGPSFMGFIGSIVSVVFGVFWTIAAANMGAPAMFPLFGVVFVIIGILNAAYNYKNATGKNRFSEYDIVSGNEEIDPFNELAQKNTEDNFTYNNTAGSNNFNSEKYNFCPYCGAKLKPDFEFCASCGKKI